MQVIFDTLTEADDDKTAFAKLDDYLPPKKLNVTVSASLAKER